MLRPYTQQARWEGLNRKAEQLHTLKHPKGTQPGRQLCPNSDVRTTNTTVPNLAAPVKASMLRPYTQQARWESQKAKAEQLRTSEHPKSTLPGGHLCPNSDVIMNNTTVPNLAALAKASRFHLNTQQARWESQKAKAQQLCTSKHPKSMQSGEK